MALGGGPLISTRRALNMDAELVVWPDVRLPKDLSSLRSLERLNLSRNNLRSDKVFKSLATIPRLTQVVLSNNELTEVRKHLSL
jgi:Leucine-rich repeat (LRR) protein